MPIRPLIYIIRLINFRPPLPTQDPSENPHNALTPKNPHNDQSLPPPVSLPIRNHARSNSPVPVGNHKAGKLSSVSMLRVGLDLRRGQDEGEDAEETPPRSVQYIYKQGAGMRTRLPSSSKRRRGKSPIRPSGTLPYVGKPRWIRRMRAIGPLRKMLR